MLTKIRLSKLFAVILVLAMVIPLMQFIALAAGVDFRHYEDLALTWTLDQINAGQSTYSEDEVLPHFVRFTGLEPDTGYYFYIYMDYYNSSKNSCGFDKLYGWDYTSRLNEMANTGISPAPSPWYPTGVGPPFSDLNSTPSPRYLVLPIDEPGPLGLVWRTTGGEGNLMYGGSVDPTSILISEGAEDGTYYPTNSDVLKNILIQFNTTTDTGPLDVEFYWGQHMATGYTTAVDNNCPADPDGILADSLGAGDWAGGGLRTKIENADGLGHTPPLCDAEPLIEPCWNPLPVSGAISIMPGAIRQPTFDGVKWFDANESQTIDPDEEYLDGWTIYLQRCTDYPTLTTCDNLTPDVTTVTNGGGYYSLFVPRNTETETYIPDYYRVCEDLDGQDPKWRPTIPLTPVSPGARDVCHDPVYIDDAYAATIPLDFGNWYGDTSVSMGPITASPAPNGRSVLIEWYTVSESDFSHFNVYRSRSVDGRLKLLGSVNPGPLGPPIKYYEFTDQKARPNKTYYYWVEAVDNDGETEMFGPASATIPRVRSVRPPKSR